MQSIYYSYHHPLHFTVKKQKYGKAQWLAQSYTASKSLNWDLALSQDLACRTQAKPLASLPYLINCDSAFFLDVISDFRL